MMKKLKKIVVLTAMLITMLSAYTLQTAAAEIPLLQVEAQTAKPGDTVTIPVKIQNNSGIMGLGLDFTYDTSIFENPQVTRGDVLASGTFNDSITTETNGEFRVLWSDTANVTENGTLLTVSFQVKSAVGKGSYPIKITNRQGDTFDEGYNDINLAECEASISINTEEAIVYNIVATAGPYGTISPSGTYSVLAGGSASYTITPNQGYHIVDVMVNQKSVGAVTSYQFVNVQSNQSITVTFAVDKSIGQNQNNNQNNTQNNVQNATPNISNTVQVGSVVQVGSLKYKILSKSTASCVGTKSGFYGKTVKIPAAISVKGKSFKVTEIGEEAFYFSNINNLTIGKNVKKIGKGAFIGCDKLKKVVIPNSVTSIGADAFYYCRKLSSVKLGSKLTTIGNYAFTWCPIKQITIPKNVKSIGKGAFGLTYLKKVTVKSIKLKKVGSEAFVVDGQRKVTVKLPKKKFKAYKKLFKGKCGKDYELVAY